MRCHLACGSGGATSVVLDAALCRVGNDAALERAGAEAVAVNADPDSWSGSSSRAGRTSRRPFEKKRRVTRVTISTPDPSPSSEADPPRSPSACRMRRGPLDVLSVRGVLRMPSASAGSSASTCMSTLCGSPASLRCRRAELPSSTA
eukprot:scaffold6529_cov121-Isochrysis_galbana.AAC.2